MINEKYLKNIKLFPEQFPVGLKRTAHLKLPAKVSSIIVCGMGGSSFYVGLCNDILSTIPSARNILLLANRSYQLPALRPDNSFYIIASYSGNTAEALSCLKQVERAKLPFAVFTAGGMLLKIAKEKGYPLFEIPPGIQPRLSSGYFMSGIFKLLSNSNLIPAQDEGLLKISQQLDRELDEELARSVALETLGKVPLIYTTDNAKSSARIAKIKFNENSKIQAFANYFPEVNHNEMVGFTRLFMNPYFLILQSKFSHPENYKRIQIFTDLMRSKLTLPVRTVIMNGDNLMGELLNTYYFIDHITYYLAELLGIDPEPVELVEEFKKLLRVQAMI